MARQARLVAPGYPHHLIQRGNNKTSIFVDDADRRRYLADLAGSAERHSVAIHAYVLMGNHVHLLLTPSTDVALSRMMQDLGRRYVGWFNHKYQRSGTLWEGRFRAQVIDADAWLLNCLRYIELNPWRAGLVSNLRDWTWSSMAHHLGLRNDPLVTDHSAFWQLGNTPFEREAAYGLWLDEGVSTTELDRIRATVNRGQALGDAKFLELIGGVTGRNLKPAVRGRPRLANIDSVPD
jgi:putative transposase